MGACPKCKDEVSGVEIEGYHAGCAECYICFGGFKKMKATKDDQGRLYHTSCMDKPKCDGCGEVLSGAMMQFEGKTLHANCFKCTGCDKSLNGVPFGKKPDGSLACGDCVNAAQPPRPTQPGAARGVLHDTSRTQYTRVTTAKTMSGGDAGNCPRCNKKVYVAEKVTGPNGTSWHRNCFTCISCSTKLEAGKEATHGKEVYCKNCYAKELGPKGTWKGAMNTTGNAAMSGLNSQ